MGALAVLASLPADGPTGPATIQLRIDDPDHRPLYNDTVSVEAGANTVLDALRRAAREDGFTVETQEFAGMGAMVVQIFSHRNAGACGWVYEVDGRSGDRSAELYRLETGDEVHWFWACHG